MLSNGDKIGPYTIRESAGQGGMATVYKAWHEGLHRLEALKVPKGAGSSDHDSAFILRLLTEARVAAGLQHPNIVAIHGVSELHAPIPYFAMDWVEGRDLAKILGERRTFSLDETVAILGKVAIALDYAHQKGVVHRDIKPANILITENDGVLEPHVVDFGISRAAEDEDGATKLTKSGMIVGTPEYMSPEQAGSGEAVDYRTDIYSLAVVAYEMLCGSPPFTAGSGVSRLSILIAHVRDVAPLYQKIPHFPREAGDELLRALSKSPGDRPQSCKEFVSRLKAAAGQNSELFSSDQAFERTPFDSTRFQPSDDATIFVRPGGAARTIPAQAAGAETALNSGESNYSLQARLAAAQAAPGPSASVPAAAETPPLPVTPRTRLLEAVPVAAASASPATPTPTPPLPVTAKRSGSRITLMAGVGGVILGALLVSTLNSRNVQRAESKAGGGPTASSAPAPSVALPKSAPSPAVAAPASIPTALPRTTRKTVTREIDFKTVTRRSRSRPAGSSYVEQDGRKGTLEAILEVTFQGEKELPPRVLSSRVTQPPVSKIVVIGTREAQPAPRPRRVRTESVERAEPRRSLRPARQERRRSAPRQAPRVKKRRTVREAPLPP
jgi:serine/threonine protein kinase